MPSITYSPKNISNLWYYSCKSYSLPLVPLVGEKNVQEQGIKMAEKEGSRRWKMKVQWGNSMWEQGGETLASGDTPLLATRLGTCGVYIWGE